MRWATRSGVHVDRAATAWLITRWIDPDAVFEYVDGIDDVPEGTTPFDMRGAALTHVGDDVTFETALRHYELDDPVLWQIAAIVHEADVADERHDAPEGPGLDLLVRALGHDHDDDGVRQFVGELLDSLHGHLRARLRG